ncbi:MAG: LPS-assembly protein LptD, partial [Alphaproteobacteria bacterium]|nr:LPS-assembly protein LptD [Alphaproteobacteria bacterium]
TWRIRAGEVTQDAEDQMMYYRDAQLEVMGVPVLYAPVFAHPDPSSERRSGFLVPKVGASNRLGAVYQQPYYWSISPHQDLVIAPRYMGNVNPLLYAEYRKRFWSGSMAFEGSFTHEGELDADGIPDANAEDQWHIFGGGQFQINNTMRWGFGVQRSSYDLYLQRYDFSERDIDRDNLLTAPAAMLASQVFVEHRGANSYGSAVAADYQSITPGRNDETLPVIQPLVQYRQVFALPDEWGRVNLDFGAASIERSEGRDYRRASAGLEWRNRWISSTGIVVEPFALARADSFEVSDLDPAVYGYTEDSFSRGVGLAGVEISYPFYRPGRVVDWVVEPVLSTTYASDDPVRSQIINEDSDALDLDEYLLFDPTRAAGVDVWEEGHWAAAGVRATAQWGRRNNVRAFFGQGHRFSGETAFDEASGVFEDSTDYITSAQVNWNAFSVEMSARLDQNDFDVNRLDFATRYGNERINVDLRYTDISDEASLRAVRREIQGRFDIAVTENWSLVGRAIHDLRLDLTRRREVGLRYQDECTQFDIIYETQESTNELIGDSQSIRIEVVLLTLGGVTDG